jgi:hypothetical protein
MIIEIFKLENTLSYNKTIEKVFMVHSIILFHKIAPWYHGAIWALREHCISYVHALICLSGLTLEL